MRFKHAGLAALVLGIAGANPSFSQETTTPTAEQKQKDKTVEQLVEEGKGFSEKEDYKTAIESYQKANKQKPTADAYLRMGFAFNQLGEYEKSLVAVVEAMELKPMFVDGKHIKSDEANRLYDLALKEEAQGQGNYKNAEKFYEAALALEPENAGILCWYGALLLKENKYNEAEKYLKDAINKNPEYRESWRWLGEVYLEQGRVGEAINAFLIHNTLSPGSLLQKGLGKKIERKLREMSN